MARNEQYHINRAELAELTLSIRKEGRGSYSFRCLHIAQSLWRAFKRGKIESLPTTRDEIIEAIQKAGIETISKNEGKQKQYDADFPYSRDITSELAKLETAEAEKLKAQEAA